MFSENKNRPDPKIRFQKQDFRRQLEHARNFKRPVKKIPATPGEVFLDFLGLDTRLGKFVAVVLAIALLCLIYLPNFFFVQRVVIQGLGQEEEGLAQVTVKNFLNQKSWLPQKNLLLLSSPALKNYLLNNNAKVLGVELISKKFPHTLILALLPRIEQFFITLPQGTFIASNDGLLVKQAAINATSAPESGLINLKIDSSVNPK